MEEKTGVARLRQAIVNQASAGEGEFHLTFDDAGKLVTEINAELLEICNSAEREIGRYVWAHGVPAPVDADGEIVPLTTEVMYGEDGREYKGSSYRSFIWSRERGQWYFGIAEGSREVASLHLRRPDSWEKLEEDAAKRVCEYAGAQKSLAHEGEYTCINCPYDEPCQFSSEGCNERMRLDLLRRSKALAGRGED